MEDNVATTPPKAEIQTNRERPLARRFRRFRDWLWRRVEPLSALCIALCTVIIMVCTIVYTRTMTEYTRATVSLLEAQKQANLLNQNSLYEQQEYNKITKENFYEQQKPSIYVPRVYYYWFDDKRKIYHIEYTILNSGNSQADNVWLCTRILVNYFPRTNDRPSFATIIFPHNELPYWQDFTDQEYADVKQGRKRVEVNVEINYTDSAKVQHYTRSTIVISNNGQTFLPYIEKVGQKPSGTYTCWENPRP